MYHPCTINKVPLPSGTSIGTRKKRATEEKQQKKNATIRQHYYPEVVFLDWVICKNYLVYNYLNTKYLFSGWVGVAGLGLCTCRKPSWPRTSTQLWSASLDIFTLTFIIHFNQFQDIFRLLSSVSESFHPIVPPGDLGGNLQKMGRGKQQGSWWETFLSFWFPTVVAFFVSPVLRANKATGQLVRNFALFCIFVSRF